MSAAFLPLLGSGPEGYTWFMTLRSRRVWALLPVSLCLAAFAACTGDSPDGPSAGADAATSSSSSSSGNSSSSSGDSAVGTSSSGGSTSSSGDAAPEDSGPVCTEAPATGARVVADCSAVFLTLIGGLPDPGTYELTSVTGQANGPTCQTNPVKDKPFKGAATVVAVDESSRELHLRLLPPDGAADGIAETVYHVVLAIDADGNKTMHALCNSPLPINYVEPDGGDAGDPPAGFARAFGDAGPNQFSIRLSALADPQSGSAFGIFRFTRSE